MRPVGLLIVLCAAFISTAFADEGDLCKSIAALEDENALQSVKVSLSHDEPALLDLDGDGEQEAVQAYGEFSDIIVDGSHKAGPDYRSVLARPDGLIELDGEYYGVMRTLDILTFIWRYTQQEDGSFRSKAVCHFDRQWTETGCGLRYAEEYYDRIAFTRPERVPYRETDYYKPAFLDEVYSLYRGVAHYGEPLTIDFDNDTKDEKVGTIIVRYSSPDEGSYEMPVNLSAGDENAIEPTFQNARLIQFLGKEKVAPGYSDSNARVSFLRPKSDYRDVLIEDRHVPEIFSYYAAPAKPYRQIYRLRGAWPEVMCKAEYSWRTLYRNADAADAPSWAR